MTAVSALIETASELIRKTDVLKEALASCEPNATPEELDEVVGKALNFIADLHTVAKDSDPATCENADEFSEKCWRKVSETGMLDELLK